MDKEKKNSLQVIASADSSINSESSSSLEIWPSKMPSQARHNNEVMMQLIEISTALASPQETVLYRILYHD
jgi:hypothetical protein